MKGKKKKAENLPEEDLTNGQRLAYFRKKKGFSQQALAKAISATQKQITDCERGRVRLNDDMISRLCPVLQVSADELLGIKSPKQQKETPTLRFTKRLNDLEKLPEDKKRAVLKILDELIRANG
jgi:transcriptional regulator with XRE-family HTH domain